MTLHIACLSPLVTSGDSPTSGLGLPVSEVLKPQRKPHLLGDRLVGTAQRPWPEVLAGLGTSLSAPQVLFYLLLDFSLGHHLSCPAGPKTGLPTWLGSGLWIRANIGGRNRLLCTHSIQMNPPQTLTP